MLSTHSRPCCGHQDVVLHPSRPVLLSSPPVRRCSLLHCNQQVHRPHPTWVVEAKQNGFPWDVFGGAKRMHGTPWKGPTKSKEAKSLTEELSHAQVLQRHAESSKTQAAEASAEAVAATATAGAPKAAVNAPLPTTTPSQNSPSGSSGSSSSAEATTTSRRDPAHAPAAASKQASAESEVLVSKSVLDSLNSNLKSIQLARSSWAVKMQELQADMQQRVRAHEATERQLREVQLEKRAMALKLQQTEDALAQLQEFQEQQLLTSLQGSEHQQQTQAKALLAKGWISSPTNATSAVPRLPETDPMLHASSPSPPLTLQAAPVATTPVTLSIRKETRPGENVYAVGNQPFCGNWVPKDALKLKWTDGHVWQRTCDVPQGVEVCFKMVEVRDSGDANWESGGDRKFTVAPGTPHGVDVVCEWDRTNKMQISPSR